ncbi:hypothetical protein Tco_0410991 [Tanacetum coccineum]
MGKKMNSRYVVENILMGCGGDYVGNEKNKKYNKYKEDLKGDVKFVELFKEYEIGDFSDEEIEEVEIVEEEEDISSVIDPSLSQVVLGKPFVELSNMTYDSSLGINMKKEHKQSVYYRNEEDKRRGVDYVMNKILGFYKECLDLRPEYLTGLDGSRTSEVIFDEESLKVLWIFTWTILR